MLYVTMDSCFLTNQRDTKRPFGRWEHTNNRAQPDVWREGSRGRIGRDRRDYSSFRPKAREQNLHFLFILSHFFVLLFLLIAILLLRFLLLVFLPFDLFLLFFIFTLLFLSYCFISSSFFSITVLLLSLQCPDQYNCAFRP